MASVERQIWNKFGIRGGGRPPFWASKGGRGELAQLFCELGFTTGAEIGVQRGAYSHCLCAANPKLRLYCIDPWTPYKGGMPTTEQCELFLARAKERLAPYSFEIVRKRSQEAAGEFKKGSLDFVYIDATHDFDNCMMDLILWTPKVRYGGIVAGHDFAELRGYGVTQAVHAYIHAHGIANWYLTFSAPFSRKSRGNTDPASFFWVQRER